MTRSVYVVLCGTEWFRPELRENKFVDRFGEFLNGRGTVFDLCVRKSERVECMERAVFLNRVSGDRLFLKYCE